MSDSIVNLPSFIEKKDGATVAVKQRLYNNRKLAVWECKVKICNIIGWIDNPRIELAKKAFIDRVGDRELTQDEVFDIMKNDPEVKLKDLRDDILKNGLREPLTLSFTGKLLDGNRRFFAIKYALESMSPTDPNRQDLEIVPAYVLSQDATEEDERNVLVEENFSSSLKIEWPDYVKAQMVIRSYKEGHSIDEIAKAFHWKKTKVNETIRIDEITEDFMAYATADIDLEDELGGGLGLSESAAENLCSKNYQFFNEAQKSFFNELKTNAEFKIQFFKWIGEGKFSSFPEVRVAYKIWTSPEAMAAMIQPDVSAAKSAKAIIDYNARVIKTMGETEGRISNFVQFLQNLSVTQMKELSQEACNHLKEALETVIKMTGTLDKQ